MDLWQSSTNLNEIKAAFNRSFDRDELRRVEEEEEEEGKDDETWKIYKRWEYFYEMRTYPSGDLESYRQARADYLQMMQRQKTEGNQRIATANWQFIGPAIIPSSGGGAGRVNTVHIMPGNSSQFFVATPGGGIWKYNGLSWSTTTDFLSRIGASDIAIDPTNTSVLYAASGDNDGGDAPSIGMLKSTNGGNTWSVIGLTGVSRMYRLLLNPLNPATLIVSTNSGIYRTVNGGDNWSQVSTLTNIRDMEYKPGDTTVIYAVQMNSSTVLFKSSNGGASFTPAGSVGLSLTGNGRSAIAVTPADPNCIYILTGNSSDNGYKGLYYSADGGLNFIQKSNSPNLLGWNSSGTDSGGQQWYDLALAVSPTNKDVVVTGGVNVWRSMDGGVTWGIAGHWTGSGAPYVHADIHDLKFDASGFTVYAGCDGGIFRKDDITSNAGSWEDLSTGLAIAQIYKMGNSVQSQEKIISGWQDNGTSLWTGPDTWRRVIGGDGMDCLIDYSNDNFQYGEIYYGSIRRSSNGGTSFSTLIAGSGGAVGSVNEDGDWVTPYILNPVNPAAIYVGKTRIYKSTDRGVTWVPHPLIGPVSSRIDAIAVAPSDTNVIYASKSGQLFKTVNDGATYSDISSGLPGQFITSIAVDQFDAGKVYVTLSGSASGSKVYYTVNGGATWTNISAGLPNLSCNSIVLDPSPSANGGMYVGMDAGVYYRDNGLSSWVSYTTNLPNVEISELEIQRTAGKLRASTYGRGIWQTDLATVDPNAINASFSASQTSICRTAAIQFTDNSTGNPSPDSWFWSFPGGTPSTSTDQHPVVTYNTAGTYNVSLKVTNSNGVSSTLVLDNLITVNSVIPFIAITGDAEKCSGLVANYTAYGFNLGNAPVINWRVNGQLTGVTGNTFSSSTLPDGATIQCETVSTAACAEPVSAESNIITLTVKPVPDKPVITVNNSLLSSSSPYNNQWFYNGTGAGNGPVFRAVRDGTYTVQAIQDGCLSLMSDPVTLKIEGVFRLFPVPNKGDLNLVYYLPSGTGRYTIRIVNGAGQVIYVEEDNSQGGLEVKRIKIDHLAAGMYQLTIRSDKTTYTRKFSKTKY